MSLSNDVRRFSVKSLNDIGEIKRGVSLSLFNSIIQDTPVDTGRARGNWQTSVREPAGSVLERDDKAGSEARKDAERVVGNSGLEDPIYMTNNLPYIEPLENGSSKQAPEGMVKRNFARIRRLIQAAVRR